ncbi:MAG: TetR family transcriptional regulator [Ilumatobacteraceae bacterium]
MAPPATSSDLRARNLARNQAEVADVALRLFSERGFDQVTIDDIAAEAGISRRTFFRYFDAKEDALLPHEDEVLGRFRALLDERPADEPILLTVRRATVTLMADALAADREATIQRMRLVQDIPAVYARSLEHRSYWEIAVRDLIAEHLGVDPTTSLVSTVTAAAAVGAARAATDVWLADGATGELADYVAAAYDLLAAGPVGPD